MEKENTFLQGEEEQRGEKEENIMEKEKLLLDGTDGSKALQEVLANLNQKNLLLNFDISKLELFAT